MKAVCTGRFRFQLTQKESDSREWEESELAALKPMHNGSVNGRGFFGADAWSILEVSMLSLLLSLEVKTCRRRSTQRSRDSYHVETHA
jgi:hypothetical protein